MPCPQWYINCGAPDNVEGRSMNERGHASGHGTESCPHKQQQQQLLLGSVSMVPKPHLACTRLRADPPARLNHTWPFQGRLSGQRGSRPPRSTLSPSQQPACAQARPRTRPRRLLLGQRAATEWCITCVYAAPQAPAWRRMRMVLPASSRRCMRRAEATCAVARPWRPAPTRVPHAGSCRPSQRARRAWPQGEWRKGARAGA